MPNAVELGGIDSATLDLPDTGNKALFLDQVDNEVKTIDPNGVIETLGGGGGGGGGLGLEFIDETTAFPYTLIKDRGTRCDFSQVVGPTEIELILPEGTGTETFRCGITITSLPEDVTVKISTSNAQTILLPDGSTTEFIENINAATEFVIAWDQSQYNYGDDWAPNYANFTGNVPFDEITVNKINGGEATATQAGTVLKNRWQQKVVASDILNPSGTITELSFSQGLIVGRKYKVVLQAQVDQDAGDQACSLGIVHDGITEAIQSTFSPGNSAIISIQANFIATTSSVEIVASSFEVGSNIDGNPDKRTNIVIFEQNNTEETTDFT